MSHQGLIQGNTVSKLCIIQTVIEKGAVSKRQRSLIDGKIVSLVLMTRALVMQLPFISRLIIFHTGYCSIVHNGSNGNLCNHTLCYSESLHSFHDPNTKIFPQKIWMGWSSESAVNLLTVNLARHTGAFAVSFSLSSGCRGFSVLHN